MRYPQGQEVHLGDRVRVGDAICYEGVVVCSIDTGEYTPRYRREDWSNLERGILVDFPHLGLVHYPDPEPTLTLMARATPPEPEA